MKYWLQKRGLLTALLASLLLSSIWTYSKLVPNSVVSSNEVSINLQPDYTITTSKDSILWPANTELDQGAQAYFYSVEPLIHYTPQVTIVGASNANLNGTATVSLIIQAVNEKQEVYWTKSLVTFPEQTIELSASGSTVDLSTILINALDINNQIDLINAELNFTNAVYQLLIVTDVHYTGSIESKSVSGTLSSSLPLTFQGVSFAIPRTSDSVISTKVNLSTTSLTPSIIERIQAYPYPVLVDLSILVFIIYLLYKDQKSIVQTKRQHRRFKEWITDGSVQTKDHINISVYSLEGLVDLAIDLDKRVIFDPDKERYYVLEERMVYVYDPERKRNIEKSEKKQLGRILIEAGELQAEQLEIGLVYQQKFNRQLGVSLMELGFIDEITLYSTLAAQANYRFVKIDADTLIIDQKWFKSFTLNQANALEAIPLGSKKDGKLVVMCANPFKPGVKDALVEIFKQEIDLVATLPSTIYKAIERWSQLDQSPNIDKSISNESSELSLEDKTRFINGYKHGNIIMELLVKGSNIVGDTILATVPENELILQWLLRNKYIRSEYAHLLLGIQQATHVMNKSDCEDLVLPDMLVVLVKAKYLTTSDVEWVRQLMQKEGLSLNEVLLKNYLVSVDTLNILEQFMNMIKGILKS